MKKKINMKIVKKIIKDILLSILKCYSYIFARRSLIWFNYSLFNLSLRGLGILNYDHNLSGEFRWLKKFLKDKKNFIIFDVGANEGKYTKDILTINHNVLIYSFEPHPKTFKKLESNVGFYENTKFFNLGIGREKGELNLFDYQDNDGSSHASLYKDVITDLHKRQEISHKVKIVSLDWFCKKNNIDKINLLKIDTEGHEIEILKGAKNLLSNKKINCIHFEFNEMNIVSKSSFKNFWDLLNEKYKMYRLLPFGFLPIKHYSTVHCEIYHYQNIVAILK